MKTERELETYIMARYPLISFVTSEERRAILLLLDIAARRKLDVYAWSVTRGIQEWSRDETGELQVAKTDRYTVFNGESFVETDVQEDGPEGLLSFASALAVNPSSYEVAAEFEAAGGEKNGAIIIACDFHPFMDDYRIVRSLREVIQEFPSKAKTLVLLGPVEKVPPELEKALVSVDLELPSLEELGAIVDRLAQSAEIAVESGDRIALCQAALGLTETEAENAIAKAIVTTDGLGADAIRLVLDEKRQVVKRSGCLEFISPPDYDVFRGYRPFQDAMGQKRLTFTPEANAFNIPPARGVVLFGPPGCGKSIMGIALGGRWQFPILRLDTGAVMGEGGGVIGSAETAIRRAIHLAERIAPCILLIDEIDKALVGLDSSGQTDGGTTARVLGFLLTWMAEHTSSVFVFATGNDLTKLRPEQLRSGRVDETWFLDLPQKAERREILEAHLNKRQRTVNANPELFNGLDGVVAETDEYSGAELEQVVKDALLRAFYAQKPDVEIDDLVAAAKAIVPLSQMREDELSAMRDWARKNARIASQATEAAQSRAGSMPGTRALLRSTR